MWCDLIFRRSFAAVSPWFRRGFAVVSPWFCRGFAVVFRDSAPGSVSCHLDGAIVV